MKIWLINHYAVPPQYYPLARPTLFAKNLIRMGHEVRIFAASTVHNSDLNLITDGSLCRGEIVDGVPYTYIYCKNFKGNGARRFLNLLEFALKLSKVTKHYEAPDAIVSTSMPPPSCALGLWLAKHRYHCKAVAEIADLWPESLISHGMAGRYHPLVLLLRRLEKWMYKTADRIVFTMGGAYKYIEDQGWTRAVPKGKVRFINNGVDLAEYYADIKNEQFADPDLDEQNTYKIVYTGSLRPANKQILALFDAIALMQGEEFEDCRFLIYGKGELEEQLQTLCKEKGYRNVRIKGGVAKKKIPYVLSKCNLNILNCVADSVLKYGGSQNKMFEYLASGNPTISAESGAYSVVGMEKVGVARNFKDAADFVAAVREMRAHPVPRQHILDVAKKYDFEKLTNDLLQVIEEC